jgi:hypothetical protein
MNVNLRVTLCLFLLISVISTVNGQETNPVDDVKIVLNKKKPDPPKGTPTNMFLDFEAVIGESDDPEKAFAQLSSFAVDDEGTIYALDFKEQKIKVFDDSADFVYAFGEKGQAPGEFQMPASIHLAPDNQLAVNDALSRKIVYFTKQGKYIDHISYATRLQLSNILMDSQGNFLARELKLEGQEMFFETVKLDRDLNPLFVLDKMGFPVPLPGSGNKINMMDMIAIYQIDSKGNIYYGKNREYEINIYTPEGKLVKCIKKEFQPQKITDEDKEEILGRLDSVSGMSPVNLREMFEFPKMFPPFQYFSIDEADRVIVRSWEKGEKNDEFVHDIFDSEGRFIAQFVSKINISIWKNGKAYAIEENDEGFQVIKRYSVRWDD